MDSKMNRRQVLKTGIAALAATALPENALSHDDSKTQPKKNQV